MSAAPRYAAASHQSGSADPGYPRTETPRGQVDILPPPGSGPSGGQSGRAAKAAADAWWATQVRTPDETRAALMRLEALANLLDTALVIPGTTFRFGLDGIIGLVPFVGDLVTTALSAYIVMEAKRIGVPKHVLFRMTANVVIDGAVGTVPLLGDAFDVMFRANKKNVALLRRHLEKTGRV